MDPDELDDLPQREEPTKPPCKHEALAVLSDAMADTYEGGAMLHMGVEYFYLKKAQSDMAEALLPEVMAEFDAWWEEQE